MHNQVVVLHVERAERVDRERWRGTGDRADDQNVVVGVASAGDARHVNARAIGESDSADMYIGVVRRGDRKLSEGPVGGDNRLVGSWIGDDRRRAGDVQCVSGGVPCRYTVGGKPCGKVG